MRAGRRGTAAAIIVVGLLATVGALQVLGPSLAARARGSGNPLVAHQVGGVIDPLNPKQSTLLVHLALVGNGIRLAATHPLGVGTAATNIASVKLGGGYNAGAATEVDVSNAFVALGIPGGFLYLAIIVLVLRLTARRYLNDRDPLVLAVLGLLIVTLGQWLNGGNYVLAPLVWLMIGWATRSADSGA
jgi:hypothetical protein